MMTVDSGRPAVDEPSERYTAEARELCPCTCYRTRKAPATGRGPLKDGEHYTGCPSECWDDVAQALAQAERRGAEAQRSADIELIQATELPSEAPLPWLRAVSKRDDQLITAIRTAPLATPGSATAATEDEALAEFTEYFVRNYPGPDTIIGDPHWHAPRIFRAARHALGRRLHERGGPPNAR